MLLLVGCSNKGPSVQGSIDPNLPKPQNIRVITSQNSAAFEWDLLNYGNLAGFFIYRSEASGAMDKVATIKDRFSTHYEDRGLKSDTRYQYRFSSYTTDGVESDGSNVVIAKTQPPTEAVSFIANVDDLPNRAKIVWRPHPNPSITGYIVQKSDSYRQKWEDIATLKGRLQAEYIDKEVESGKVYNYRVVAKAFDGSLSIPSQSVEVKVKKLPLPVDAIYATKDIPKQIVVSWEAGEQKEFANFRLYSADKTDGNYRVLTNTVEKKYIDKVNEDGIVKYYKVTVIDKDGLESPSLNIATGLTKALPQTPKFTQAVIKENKVFLTWKNDEKGDFTYRITKKWGSFINKNSLTFNDIRDAKFEDKDVSLGETYNYSIEAVDKDGLASKPSEAVELFVPKGM
jgi:hypothetical protein